MRVPEQEGPSGAASHCDMSDPLCPSLQHEQGKGCFECFVNFPISRFSWAHMSLWPYTVAFPAVTVGHVMPTSHLSGRVQELVDTS